MQLKYFLMLIAYSNPPMQYLSRSVNCVSVSESGIDPSPAWNEPWRRLQADPERRRFFNLSSCLSFCLSVYLSGHVTGWFICCLSTNTSACLSFWSSFRLRVSLWLGAESPKHCCYRLQLNWASNLLEVELSFETDIWKRTIDTIQYNTCT